MVTSLRNSLGFYLPSIAGGILVGGIAVASGGSALQSGIAAIATGVSGSTSAALVAQKSRHERQLFESERNQLQQNLDRQQKALGLNVEVESLERKLEILGGEIQKREDVLQQRKQKINQEIEEREDVLEQIRTRISTVKAELPNLEELEKLGAKLVIFNTQITERKAELATIKREIEEGEARRRSLDELTVELNYKQNEVQDFREKINTLNQQTVELEIFRSTYDALVQESENLKQQKQQLLAEVPRLEQERDRVLSEIQKIESRAQESARLSREVTQLEARLRGKQGQRRTLEQQIEQLDAERAGLQEQIARYQQEIQTRNGQLRELSQQVETREQQQERLGSQVRELQAQIEPLERLRNEVNQLDADLRIKRGQQGDLERRIEQLDHERAKLDDEVARRQQEIEAHENRLKALTAELQTLQQQQEQLRNQVRELQAQVEPLERLRNEVNQLDADLRSKQSLNTDLERRIEQLQSEQLRQQADKEREGEILEDLQSQIQRAKGELKDLENSAKEALQSLESPINVGAKQQGSFANEAQFLTVFTEYLGRKGLFFPERMLRAFHTSVKVQDISALVILAGISGTGKSELPQAYAEFIGAPLVMLPVQPRWDSPQDLQGFYNYIERKYKPTELMRYLYQHSHSNQLRGRMVLVLLDEMNLARVEYYFSDFLSKLESRRNKPTYLELEVGSLQLSEQQRRVLIPKEFLFVGTMNEDETTQALSDKVLDRANVLTFSRPEELKLRGERPQNFDVPKQYLTWNQFESWIKQPTEESELVREVKSYVDRANEIMEKLGRPFAHRVYQAIAKYVMNYPQADQNESVRKQAIADQFGQKLLPKLRGVMVEDSLVREPLEQMKVLIGELGDEPLTQAFEKACQGQYGQFQWKGMVYQQQ